MNSGGMQNDVAQSAKALMLDWVGVRKQVQFWLRLDKVKDLEILEIIDWFKRKGLFRSRVMTGLRVMFAYENNNVDGIFEALPNLKSMIGQGCDDNTDILNEILRNQRLLLERGITAEIPPTGTAIMQPAHTGRPLTTKTLTAPTFSEDDDDVLPVIATKAAQTDSAANFVNALQNLH